MTFNEVILGTSVFLFAPQFGHRSRLYELDFQKRPENIKEILNKSYSMGVSEIMLRDSQDLVEALGMSLDDGCKWSIIGFTDDENFEHNMDVFKRFDTTCVILDGFFVDENLKKGDYDKIIEFLVDIKKAGFDAGIETRTPFNSLDLIRNSPLMDYFDTLMMPLNFYGYMMDCNFLTSDNKDKIKELVVGFSDKRIIANRTLAAGVLSPSEAYEFISGIDYIDAVCVGMAKTSEVEETLGIINNARL